MAIVVRLLALGGRMTDCRDMKTSADAPEAGSTGRAPAVALSRMPVDRNSPVPLYFQVELELRRAIDSGRLAPGDRIPNEIELADDLGLSRPTIRRAIDDLVQAGLVVRRRGVGTHVASKEVRRRFELTSLFDDLSSSGRDPRTTVLTLEHACVDPRAAGMLGTKPDDPLTYIERVRHADGAPLAVLRNWLPPGREPFTAADLTERGLYSLMRDRGERPAVARQRITARAALQREASLLGVRRGAPLLTMQRTAYDSAGRAIEYGDHVYRADGYALEVTVFDR
jgi:DNA-binding GntR family transcriptional regulator